MDSIGKVGTPRIVVTPGAPPGRSWPGHAAAAIARACYRPAVVRTMLFPCHIGMCIPSAGTALGIYASKIWMLLASQLLSH